MLDSEKYPFCYNYDPRAVNDPSAGLDRPLHAVQPGTQPADRESDEPRRSQRRRHLGQPDQVVHAASSSPRGSTWPSISPHTPFDATFARVMEAIRGQAEFRELHDQTDEQLLRQRQRRQHRREHAGRPSPEGGRGEGPIVPVRHTHCHRSRRRVAAAAPVITGTMTAYATVGRPFSYRISAIYAPRALPPPICRRG